MVRIFRKRKTKTPSSQRQFHHRIRTPDRRPHPHHLQRRIHELEQRGPVLQRALLAPKLHHHLHVERVHDLFRAVGQRPRRRQDLLRHEDACAFLHGPAEPAQDAEAILLGPIVQDVAKEIDVGVGGGNRLGVEEAVGGESHTSLELDGDGLVSGHF